MIILIRCIEDSTSVGSILYLGKQQSNKKQSFSIFIGIHVNKQGGFAFQI